MLGPYETRKTKLIVPASFAQSAIWLARQVTPHPSASNLLWLLKLHGPMDLDAIRWALSQVIGRHDALRATFEWTPAGLEQRILPPGAIECSVVKLDSQVTPVIEEMARQFGHVPFDLARGPLFRFQIIRINSRDHVLLCAFHHLVIDGHSWQLFVDELLRHYSGNGISPLEAQYPHFCEWQRRQLSLGNWERARDYWQSLYQTAPSSWDLPTDRARPKMPDDSGATHSVTLPADAADLLRTLAARSGTTPFRIAFAAFFAFLHRTTGHSNLLVTTTLIGRSAPRFSSLIGLFVNTGGVRLQITDLSRFDSLVAQAHAQIDASVAHEDYPFDKAVRDAAPRFEMGRDPFSPAAFVRLPTSRVRRAADLEVSEERVFLDVAGHDVTVYMQDNCGSFQFTWAYRTALFERSTIERFSDQFQNLLRHALERPETLVPHLDLMSASERRQILVDWNATDRRFADARSVQAMVEAQVERTPDRIAVISERSQFTYRQVNAAANQIASRLRSRGVGTGHFVPILMETSAEFLIAELAVIKSGAAFVPLDPSWPKQRLCAIFEMLKPRVVLIRDFDVTGLVGQNCEAIIAGGPFRGAEANPRVDVSPNDPMYCIFTSGSTGLPKGAVNGHRGIINRLSAMTDLFGTAAEDAVLATSPAFFDSSVWQYFWPLTCGGRSVVLPTAQVANPGLLPGLLGSHRITFTDFVPSAFHLLVEHLHSHPETWPAFARLRRILIGGEALAADPVYKFKTMFPHVAVTNAYGPTESSIGAIFHEVPDEYTDPVPIGRPIPNVRAVIVDRHLELVPVGTAGELCLGGVCVGLGYLNDPEATATAFVANPFSELDCSTLYRTGDLARFRADGAIECLGRIDQQVKIRGLRIELGEIETVLTRHPQVRQAAVLLREDNPGDRRLVAYIVAQQPDTNFAPSNLREFLEEALPAYMIPSAFVVLDVLPLTANGKIDRPALPIGDTATSASHVYEAPVGEIETALANIWAKTLTRERIGRHDNFFDLGGHSLLAVQLSLEIEKRFDRKLSIADFFKSPTVEALTRRLSEEQSTSPWRSLVPLQPLGTDNPVFCVHGWGGGVSGFLELARELAPSRPVYALQAVGLRGHEPRHTSVEEMAAHYAREIRTMRPDGPYHIVGSSLGGWIAYEVAQEISRQGGRVAFLGLIDTRATPGLPWIRNTLFAVDLWTERMPLHLQQLKGVPHGGRLRYIMGRLRSLRSHMNSSIALTNSPLPPIQSEPAETGEDYFRLVAARYQPRKYLGDLALFVTEDTKPYHYWFWKRLVLGAFQVQPVPGSHLTVIDNEHAQGFAAILEQALRRAEATEQLRQPRCVAVGKPF